MENKLIIVMDNGIKYEYFKTLKINNTDDMTNAIQSLGFMKNRPINNKNWSIIGLPDGGNAVILEEKILSYEFAKVE